MKSGTLLVLFVLAAVGFGYCAGDSNGAARERGRAIQQKVDTLTRTVHTRDTVFRTVDRARLRQDTVWQVVRERDTLVVVEHDTAVVYVPRAVADSTISMCRLTLFSCTAQVAARDTLIGALRTQVDFERDRHPSTFWTWFKIGLAYVLGWLTGR